MSDEILKALIQLFAVISKQDGGVTEGERNYVLNFFKEQLSHDTIPTYIGLYDKYAGYNRDNGSDSPHQTSLQDSLKALAVSKKINKTLTQQQKVIALIEAIGLINSDDNVSKQELVVMDTVAAVFNITDDELALFQQFVTGEQLPGFNTQNTLIGQTEEPEETAKFMELHLEGRLTFIWVKSVDLYFAKYDGVEELLLNSMTMTPGKSYLFSVGSTIKLPKGEAVYFSDIITRFNDRKEKSKLSFIVDNLEYKFANGHFGVHNIKLREKGGQLIGIMGASGSGKTTLLRVLAGILKPSKGSVRINGVDIHKDHENIEGVVGYVPQDDILIEELTVYQNLYFNAQLSISHMEEQEIKERITRSLSVLGLEHAKNLKVGNVLDQTISGGQRKRLNIAMELIREPSVLFVDEPTSGLSSRDSENVIDLLKELTLMGNLIFTVIHQPSSDIYKMFDKVIIMDTGGHPIFYGHPLEAISYFKQITQQVDQSQIICEKCGTVTPEQIFNIVEAKVVDEFGNFSDKRKVSPMKWYSHFKNHVKIPPVREVKESPPTDFKIPSLLRQYWIILTRDFLSKVTDKQYLLINLLEAPLLALILAYIIRFNNSPSGTYAFQYNDNIPAYLLMSIIVALFLGLSVSAEEIIKDRKLRAREHFLNLSDSSYLLSKITILFTLSAFQILSFVLVGHYILDIQGSLFSHWLVLFSCAGLANLLGLNISATFKSAVTVYIVIPIILIPQMILAGLLFSFDKLNSTISSEDYVPLVGDIMASRWALEAMAVDQFINNPYENPIYALEAEAKNANYRAAYWSKELANQVNYISNNFYKGEMEGEVTSALMLLKSELQKEPFTEGLEKIDFENDFHIKKVTPKFFVNVHDYLNKVSNHYNSQYSIASRKKDKLIGLLEQSDTYQYDPRALKDKYFNQSLSDLVRNSNTKDRILIEGDKLVRKIDPVYFEPVSPDNPLNYRAHFYAPVKYFMGTKFDTYSFNLAVIWLMALGFYATLYFDVFNKIIKLMERIRL